MKTILFAIAMLVSINANAAMAFLVRCEPSTSVTGKFIYVGTYVYGGIYFRVAFDYWCPYTIDVR